MFRKLLVRTMWTRYLTQIKFARKPARAGEFATRILLRSASSWLPPFLGFTCTRTSGCPRTTASRSGSGRSSKSACPRLRYLRWRSGEAQEAGCLLQIRCPFRLHPAEARGAGRAGPGKRIGPVQQQVFCLSHLAPFAIIYCHFFCCLHVQQYCFR